MEKGIYASEYMLIIEGIFSKFVLSISQIAFISERRGSDFNSDNDGVDCCGGEAVRERAEGGAVREVAHQGTPPQVAAKRRQGILIRNYTISQISVGELKIIVPPLS